MIIYKHPDTGYMCKCSLASSVPDGISYREVPSHVQDEFNPAITDYDAKGVPVFDLNKAKAIKVKEAQREASDFMKVVTDEYDQSEIDTWTIQEEEARGNKPDSYLLELEMYSGVPLNVLKTKIIAKADAFRSLSAQAVGRRQKKEAAVKAAATLDELKAVTF